VAVRSRAVVVTLAGAVAGAALIGFGSFGLISSLAAPTGDERLGIRVVERLQSWRSGGAVLHLEGRSVSASCRRLAARRRLIQLGDGERLLLVGRRVRSQIPEGDRSPAGLELRAVKAYLAGSRSLYLAALKARLVRGRDVLIGPTSVGGLPAYRIRIGNDRPRTELVVAQETLTPLEASYRSARVSGWSSLRPPETESGC